MKVYTFLTDSHKELFNIFIKQFPFCARYELVVKWMPQECATGSFMSQGWNSTMLRKVDYVLQSLEETPEGEWFVHSDCDIVLFEGWDTILTDSNKNDLDIIFQNDYDLLCAGFFFCKSNTKTKLLWKTLRDSLSKFANDQIGLNYIIQQTAGISVGVLPEEYFTYGAFRKGVWNGEDFKVPNIKSLKMFHANYTEGVTNKINLLNKVVAQKRDLYNYEDLRPYPPLYPAYPPYSDISQYIEHYFFNFFNNNKSLFTGTERQYIPAFWTTIYNDRLKINVQEYLDALPRDGKYFTVNQHDDGIKYVLPKDTLVFSASERGNGDIVPIPLITSPLPDDGVILDKDILCSFVGTMTHPIRAALYETYKANKDFYFSEARGWAPSVTQAQFEEFKNVTKRSKFTLCPRGNIIQSFRIYEVLQLNSVPVIVTDVFYPPFEHLIDWSSFSIIVSHKDIDKLHDMLISISDDDYNDMLKKGKEVYAKYFTLHSMSSTIAEILCD